MQNKKIAGTCSLHSINIIPANLYDIVSTDTSNIHIIYYFFVIYPLAFRSSAQRTAPPAAIPATVAVWPANPAAIPATVAVRPAGTANAIQQPYGLYGI